MEASSSELSRQDEKFVARFGNYALDLECNHGAGYIGSLGAPSGLTPAGRPKVWCTDQALLDAWR